MPRKMKLPKIGVNMTEAVIGTWLVKVGDRIQEGSPICDAETDKASQEILATDSGIVAELLFDEGETVQTYEDLLVLIDEGEVYEKECVEVGFQNTIAMKEIPVKEQDKKNPVSASDKTTFSVQAALDRVRISPLARKLAEKAGLDIGMITPSTPGGRIVAKDVRAYQTMKSTVSSMSKTETSLALQTPVEEILEQQPMSALRRTIATRMQQSAQEKPTVGLTLTADATALLALRAKYMEEDIKVSIDALMVKIVAQALSRYRNINTVLEGNEIIVKKPVHIGVAVDTERGLIVPVIKNADQKIIAEIGAELSTLAAAAKKSKLSPEKMQGGTFTITNLGMFGIEQFTPIINPPECGILALGAVQSRFVPDENDLPVLKKVFQMTLVFDHRIVDGAPAARFLYQIKKYVENPELML